MKRFLCMMLALMGLAACGNNPRKTTAAEPQADGVEVLCFYGAKRCASCIAIERGAREAVETGFADRLAAGRVRFRVIDLTEGENEALADKYEVAWSSLLVVHRRDGAETVDDMTEFAFAHARRNPEKFKAELSSRIEKALAR